MALSEKTKRALVTALNPSFDSDEVNAQLRAMEALQATSPIIKAAAPNNSMYLTGLYYDAAFAASGAGGSYSAVANNIDLIPFVSPVDVLVDQFSIRVLTDAASSNARVLIYDSADDGTPNRKVYESANISTATVATPVVSASFRFLANTSYWIGVHTSGTPVLRSMVLGAVLSLGSTTADGSGTVCVRRAVTFGSAPDQWGFLTTDLVFVAPPCVRFRVV